MSLFYADELAAAIAAADVVDLFGGPGGWAEACRRLGLIEVGVESDRWACATRRAAGHRTVEHDVAAADPLDFVGVRAVIGSPPCQAYSTAGKQEGRQYLDALRAAIVDRRWSCRPARDPRIWLVLEIGRWVEALQPDWVLCEQVPAILPLWAAYAEVFAADGYSTWTGVLNAADFGVPQTRQRAILIASRTRTVAPPLPTHDRGGGSVGLAPWVPVIAVLPHLAGRLGFPRLDDRGDSPDGYRERDRRPTDQPAFALTEKARSWVLDTGNNSELGGGMTKVYTRPVDEASPTIRSQSRSWFFDRPSTTIAGDDRMFSPGGHRANDGRDNSTQIGRSDNAVKLTISDALVLQSFRADYPVKGTKSKKFEQVGNAIPPLLAEHILRCVVDS